MVGWQCHDEPWVKLSEERCHHDEPWLKLSEELNALRMQACD